WPISFGKIELALLAELAETRRTIELVRFGEIVQPLATTCFVKPTSEKWFTAKVYPAGANLPEGPLADDPTYVQAPVTFSDEVRCFVQGDKILTASLYRVDRVAWDDSGLPPEALNFDDRIGASAIPDMVRRIRTVAGARLPEGVVMDFGKLPSGEWALIEFNEAWASGLYYCDPDRALDVIVASQSSLGTQ
ncbi:MAG TPA: ATP-grasp domain-containing protein, partial [Lacunisphaera sp.]|nr:ATP-grasp domain-containing protein [Lacunisphaera sp.]